MIKSMTAFGRAKTEGEFKDITIEIKSVNSRFFDCSVKIPRVYSFLEERIKSYVQKNAVSRAKVDVYVTVDDHGDNGVAVKLDTALAQSYVAALYELRDKFSLTDDISVMSVAANRDLFTYDKVEKDLEADWEDIRKTLDLAIESYKEMREAEGAKIEADIRSKIAFVATCADEVEKISLSDAQFKSYRGKVKCYIGSGALKYKFCYGEYPTRAEAQRNLATIRRTFSDAFVVHYSDGKIVK